MSDQSGERKTPWLVVGAGIAGLALIAASALGYLIGFDSGRMFALGMALFFSCALYEGARAKKLDIEAIIIVGAGLAFFVWLLSN